MEEIIHFDGQVIIVKYYIIHGDNAKNPQQVSGGALTQK